MAIVLADSPLACIRCARAAFDLSSALAYNTNAENGEFVPWVTLADGPKVIKYCSMHCWSSYRHDQMKLPESKQDPDIGVIVCSECGREAQMNSPKRDLRGSRSNRCHTSSSALA